MALGGMAGRAVFELAFTGDTRSLSRAFDTASHSVNRFSSETDRHQRGLGRYATTIKTGVAGAIVGMGAFLADSTQKAVQAEVAQARLTRTLRNAGISWSAHKDQIDRVITSTANLSGLEDHDLKDAFTNIVRVTGDHPGGLKQALDLVSLSADIARAKHIDVATAGQLVGRVAGGNTGILRRYGIEIDKGSTATEALGQLHEKFKGQAKAYGETAQGAQDRFRVAVTRLQEEIGTKLLPVLTTLINVTVDVITHVGQVADAIANAAKSTVRWFGDLPDRISTAITKAPKETVKLLTDAGEWILDTLWSGFKASVGKIADLAEWLKDQVIDAVKKAFGLGGGGGGDRTTNAFTGGAHGASLSSASIRGFAAGGDFTVTGPAMLSAGQRENTGGQRVTITPLTRPRLGGASDVQIIMQQPSFSAPGHVTEFGRKLAFRAATA